jgi:hypothetical protein
MRAITIEALKAALARKDYLFHDLSDQGDFNLNLVGVRAVDVNTNTFHDVMAVFFVNGSAENIFIFPITTDPGTYWRENPDNVNGTAILVPGQYKGSWQLGLHKGYAALVQCKPITVYRDNNRDAVLDIGSNAKTETGLFGVNIHHASDTGTSVQVDKWSAGCQVFANIDDFNLFMALCRKAAALHGNAFTYTLINEGDLQ